MTEVFVSGERARPDWLRSHPKAWTAALAVVCFGGFMGQLDASVVALTYHAIGRDFGASLAVVQWVSLSYLIALGVLLVPVGRASDRLGRKRVYLWGFGLFAVASLGCAVAPTLPLLVTSRAVQGMAAAMLQANSVALVATSVPRDRLRSAIGVQVAAQAVGLAIGPTVGGLVVATAGWRWVFAVNVAIAAVAIIAGRLLLPRTRVASHVAPGHARQLLAIADVRAGLLGAACGYLLLFGPIVLVAAVLQGHGATPLHAGFVVAALPVGFALAATFGERLLPGSWSSAARGRSALAASVAALLGLAGAGHAQAGSAVALAVLGCALGVFTPANNALVMAAAPRRSAALAGGLVNTARTAGIAAGTAIVVVTLTFDNDGRVSIAALSLLATLTLAAANRVR